MSVPNDVAVIGYDNSDRSVCISPQLTTIDHCDEVIGREMLSLLMNLVDSDLNQSEARQVTVSPKLIVRNSSPELSC
ncbi:substrate-binding domain-containing protein [Poriferisphaera sp. WC338]|uniref:substrate-binding domain-containing protein n=1 Tax=Poriferisphaera sp. WC338 TaxID=3425129 RepID=UPI003D818641